MAKKTHAVVVDLIDLYWDDPVAFAEDMLGFKSDEWQAKVMMDVATNARTSVRSGQGVGKTGLEAVLVIWYLCCRPYPRIVCTAPTRQQLYDVLWAEIAKWLNSTKIKRLLRWTKTKVYMVGREDRWFATAKTATRPENMQGFHEEYMLFIVDEASGIADPIMEAVLGTLSGEENKLLMCGNPTRTSGVFFDSHNQDRELYKTHKVSSLDSKRTSKENIEMLKRKYNEGSDVYRVRVLGEFPKAEADAFIALELAETAKLRKVKPTGNILRLGVDVARFGDDETIIAPRIGGKCFDLKAYTKQDTTATTGWVLATARDMFAAYPQLVRAEIMVDDTGVGGGVTDQLNEAIRSQGLPYTVYPVNNESTAEDKEHYDNLVTEQHAALREWLQENFSAFIQGNEATIQLPNDEKLIAQLTSRKYYMTNKGKIRLESKKDMKKRGLASPDRADAIVLAFAPAIGIFDPLSAALLRGAKVYD